MPGPRPNPNPTPDPTPNGPCVAIHRYRSSLHHAVEVQILKTGDSFAVIHGAESTSSAPTRKDGFASLEEAARATGAFCLSPSRPDSEHSFESTHLTRDDLIKLIVAVQSRDRISPTTFRFEVEGRPYVCTGGFECFEGRYETFASFSGCEDQVVYRRPWIESIVRTPDGAYLVEAYPERDLEPKTLRLTARQVREWLEWVSQERPNCLETRREGLMAYARRHKDEALLAMLRVPTAEFGRIPAETVTASGFRPEHVEVTDFEFDREGGTWSREWFDLPSVVVMATVRGTGVATADAARAPTAEAALVPYREEGRMWRAIIERRFADREVCVVALDPETHERARAALAEGEKCADEDEPFEPGYE